MIPSKHKIAAGIIVGIIVLIGGIAIWIHSAANRKFEQMERRVKALHRETLKRDVSRPPRPGTSLPGNAWEDYDKALAAVGADKSALGAVNLFVQRDPKADGEKAKELVSAHGPTLMLLKSAVRHARGDRALQWELGSEMQFSGFQNYMTLANLTAAKARLLTGEGKSREAADLLLDGCQLARDMGTNSVLICQLIAMAMYSTEFEELRDVIISGSLSKEDLVDVEKALQVADQYFPKNGQTMLNESLFMGYTLLRCSGGADLSALFGSGASSLYYWRYGFSPRLAFASAFEQIHEMNQRGGASDDLPWPEEETLISELRREARSSKNPIVQMSSPVQDTGRYVRERKAQLRLLRAAAIWKASGTCPELDDPFGNRLLHSEKDGVLRVWSVGRDGNDHGGVGSFRPEAGKDILLEWKRP